MKMDDGLILIETDVPADVHLNMFEEMSICAHNNIIMHDRFHRANSQIPDTFCARARLMSSEFARVSLLRKEEEVIVRLASCFKVCFVEKSVFCFVFLFCLNVCATFMAISKALEMESDLPL